MSKAMQFKARIKNLAVQNHVPAQAILQNFMLERLLERIAVSKYKNSLVLKGGMLISSLVGIHTRTTMDMDTTLRGLPLTEETVRAALVEICAASLDDQVELVLDHIDHIREDDPYGGFRAAIIARFESISTPLKLDITTGDVITPEAVEYTFHSNFENKQIDVFAYPIETILAEKVETILRRGVLNTRPRDFYDVYTLLKMQSQAINRATFRAALHATAEKRLSLPALREQVKIIRTVQADSVMKQRWARYCKENAYTSGIEFDQVIAALIDILCDPSPSDPMDL